MPYRRRRYDRYRLGGAAVGAALGAGNVAYRMAKGAAGRWGRRLVRLFKRRKVVTPFRNKRYRSKFLKTIGMAKVVRSTHVSRGSHHLDGAVDATISSLMAFYLNDPSLVFSAGGSLGGNSGPATGFTHMAAMYRHCQVLGCRAYITVRQHNILVPDSGDGDHTAILAPIKLGTYVDEGAGLANAGIGKWQDVAMLGEQIKTYIPGYTSLAEPIRFTKKWSLRKHLGSRFTSAFEDYTVTNSTAPTNKAQCMIWQQVADCLNAPASQSVAYDIDWTIKYFCKWSEMKALEDDMKQDTPN